MTGSPRLRVEEPRPQIAVLTIDRADRRNALDWELVDELHAAVDVIDRDNDLRVVVLTGAGAAFCTGLELVPETGSTRAKGLGDPAGALRAQEHLADLLLRLRRIPQPVIAAVNGEALGSGLALALFSDLRVAAESATFATQLGEVGLVGADTGTSWALPRLIGASRASELILTARRFDAHEAERIGLVARVVPDGTVVDAALELADELCALSPFGVVMTKEVMWTNLSAPSMEAAVHLENRTQILAARSGDFDEAVRAFADKRKPDFRRPRDE